MEKHYKILSNLQIHVKSRSLAAHVNEDHEILNFASEDLPISSSRLQSIHEELLLCCFASLLVQLHDDPSSGLSLAIINAISWVVN